MTDILDFGPDKPPWRPSRRQILVAVVLLALVAGGVATVALADRMGHPAGTPSAAPSGAPPPITGTPPSCPPGTYRDDPAAGAPAALILGCAGDDPAGLDRVDRGAEKGPWTVVVRRAGGSLGRNGAVVTFPVGAPPPAARKVAVGRASGRALPHTVIWPVGGGYARIRGDLAEADLVAIATDTSVVGGRPATNPPAGFAVAGGGPYRPPNIHEMRYGSPDVGDESGLGAGLIFTGVARGGGFEDQLYATGFVDGGTVGRRPAVLSTVFGGNGAIAWEPAPGVVAWVGYSGAEMSQQAAAALHRLAERTRPIDDAGWRRIRAQTAEQTNNPGG